MQIYIYQIKKTEKQGRLVGNDLVAVKVVCVEVESVRGEREFISALSDIYQTRKPRHSPRMLRTWRSTTSWQTAASTILCLVRNQTYHLFEKT